LIQNYQIGGEEMKKGVLWATLAMLVIASPVYADWCLQLSDGLSGSIGFFRFVGAKPTTKGSITPLTARASGYSPAFGTATVRKDGSTLELGVTFFSDSVQGQFNVYLEAPGFTTGFGYGSYGEYGVNSPVGAKVVSCRKEPPQQ
jgi:hypothetical protein